MDQKMVSLYTLADICDEFRKKKKTIVHCHGCFDLLHLGHIKYFEAAKKMGDVLVVTITEDRFVQGKGPNRPYFTQTQRAEAIAALQVVDYLAINHWETAIKTIQMLKPDIYVKGSDYKNMEEDVTGNIKLEADAVQQYGGKVAFTDEIMFSSSHLLNRFFPAFNQAAAEYLSTIREENTLDRIVTCLEKASKLRVLVVGDIIIDEYRYCEPKGAVSKDPIISTRYRYTETYLGGSLAIARHVARFAENVGIVGVVGDTNRYHQYILEKLDPAIKRSFFVRQGTPTTAKIRYVSPFKNIKLFKVEEMNDSPIDSTLETDLIVHLEQVINDYDIVIVADFGHGMLTPKLRRWLELKAPYLVVNAQTNSANYGYNLITNYKRADVISIDEQELRLATVNQTEPIDVLVKQLRQHIACPHMNITLGTRGMNYFDNSNEYFAPVLSTDVVDSVGAGDAVLSIISILVHQGLDPKLIPFVGNAVGALAIRIMGNRETINKVDLIKFVTGCLK